MSLIGKGRCAYREHCFLVERASAKRRGSIEVRLANAVAGRVGVWIWLSGKVALVTDRSKGIGKDIAGELVEEGANPRSTPRVGAETVRLAEGMTFRGMARDAPRHRGGPARRLHQYPGEQRLDRHAACARVSWPARARGQRHEPVERRRARARGDRRLLSSGPCRLAEGWLDSRSRGVGHHHWFVCRRRARRGGPGRCH
jgi:hypothetical protein